MATEPRKLLPPRPLLRPESQPVRLGHDFFAQPTLEVSRALLGKCLMRRDGELITAALVTEVEAYRAPRDAASHAYRGRRTARVEPLYGPPGTLYVYLVYGLHWLLNVATVAPEVPEGVLIRGVVIDPWGEPQLAIGPGKLTKALRIDGRFDGKDGTLSPHVWFEDHGVRIPRPRVLTGPRIGIDYAGPYWAARPWRFRVETRIRAGVIQLQDSRNKVRAQSS